jgi:16S rRNA (uracil1498-N3)-methyltransferase
MTRRRWIADEVAGNRAALTGAHAEHLSRVLRVRLGQQFDIACESVVRHGTVVAIGEGRVEFELGDEVPSSGSLAITLALAIFRFDRMEWAIEKCTELGVERIIPVIAQRSEPHLASAAHKRIERWERVARQAAEQSRRAGPPVLSQPITLKGLVDLPATARIVLSESEREVTLRDAVSSSPDDVILAVGPEGGWTQTEEELFRAAGWTSASLGSTILRAETAAIAAVAIVLAQLQ